MGGMHRLEVFADVSCPFTHVGLVRFVRERERRGLTGPVLWVRPWPLELVNGEPLTGPGIGPKVAALRASVAPDLFAGFDAETFPSSTLPVLAAEAAAHRVDPVIGERFSLAVRDALFERGLDPTSPAVLDGLLADHGIDPGSLDPGEVLDGWREGRDRNVVGSPYFFTGSAGWFCPSLSIDHDDAGYAISVDVDGFEAFLTTVFDGPAT